MRWQRLVQVGDLGLEQVEMKTRETLHSCFYRPEGAREGLHRQYDAAGVETPSSKGLRP